MPNSNQILLYPLFGALGEVAIGLIYWLIIVLFNRVLHLEAHGLIFNEWTVFLLVFPLIFLTPKRSIFWKPEVAILTGFLAAWGLFTVGSISNTLHSMKYEYLQVNNWSEYIVGGIIAYGFPLSFIGLGLGFIVSKFHNRKIDA